MISKKRSALDTFWVDLLSVGKYICEGIVLPNNKFKGEWESCVNKAREEQNKI